MNHPDPVELSLVVPFFNEERLLADTLDEIWRFLSEQCGSFQLILADDGSTDRSGEIATGFAATHACCTVVSTVTNRGKGLALTMGLEAATLPVAGYTDADLEIPLRFLAAALKRLHDCPDLDVCIGSKMISPQPPIREIHRRAGSLVYNGLVRWLLHSPVRDHQCGLKLFRRRVKDAVLPQMRETGWAWDTEFLLIVRQQGFSIEEIPVELYKRRPSTVPFFRVVMLLLLKIREFRKRGLVLPR